MRRLPDASPTRKQRFTAALELAGLTIGDWCEIHSVSRTHLYLVFEGERVPGADLDAAIEATIEKYLTPAA